MVVLEISICEEMGCFGSRPYGCREEESEFEREERERRFACVYVFGPHTASQQHKQPPKLSSNWFRTKLEQTN